MEFQINGLLMSKSLDLNLLPVARFAGNDQTQFLGLHAAEQPRRAARGRAADRLVLYLAVIGNAPLPPAKQERLLVDLSNLYYQTSGSVTSGMRAVAKALNDSLLDRNLQIANSGRQGVGLLTQFVLRDDQVYLGLSGPMHVYLIASQDVEEYYDPSMAGKGLGQGKIPPISYHQARLVARDTLILAAQPGSDWSKEGLAGLHGLGPQSLRRKLFPQNMDVHAVLIQASQGKGKFFVLRPQAAGTRQPSTASVESQTGPQFEPVAPDVLPAEPMVAISEDAAVESSPVPADNTVFSENLVAEEVDHTAEHANAYAESAGEQRSSPARRRLDFSSIGKALAVVGLPVLNAFQRTGKWIGALFERMLPEGLPSSVMAFIAIAVPVVIVTVASVTYQQLGRSTQYEALYAQAEQKAAEALAQQDIRARRVSWEQLLLLLQEVESYSNTRPNPDTQVLREQAIAELDELDLVKRVDYQPAIVDQLPPVVSVARLVISDEDLYLLDGNSGNVIRAVPSDQGYVVDNSFQCGPGPIGVTEAGKLIDMVAWPAGFVPKASLLALDDRGNVIYCAPDEPPQLESLTAATSQSWGNPTAITLDGSDLYALDPTGNAVWIYWDSEFNEEPSMFFDQEIPPLQDVIDITANNGELYLLNADGNTTLCYLGTAGVSPTRCGPASYIDDRPGLEGLTMVSPYAFEQISFTPPPDPSLFFLEPDNHAVFHFSLRNLVLESQYLPKEPLSPRPATGFYVDAANRTVYLAIANEVYYGIMP